MKLTKKEVQLIKFIRKMKRIKWGNILLLLIGVGSALFILNDFRLLIFKGGCFTWFGLATHIFAWFVVGSIYSYLFEEE